MSIIKYQVIYLVSLFTGLYLYAGAAYADNYYKGDIYFNCQSLPKYLEDPERDILVSVNREFEQFTKLHYGDKYSGITFKKTPVISLRGRTSTHYLFSFSGHYIYENDTLEVLGGSFYGPAYKVGNQFRLSSKAYPVLSKLDMMLPSQAQVLGAPAGSSGNGNNPPSFSIRIKVDDTATQVVDEPVDNSVFKNVPATLEFTDVNTGGELDMRCTFMGLKGDQNGHKRQKQDPKLTEDADN
ncbi:MAG TPA: hypothetical protein VKR58_03255 [Aquella sp.]|nr:hypothetical protein [Aquella sp.]